MQTAQDVFDQRKVTARQILIFGVCLFIALLDGFDTQSIAFTGPAIADDFGFDATDMAPVITASTVGMVIGAMTLGTLGDRIGRRRSLVVALAIVGIFSLIAAFATGLWQIVLLRFLIGIGRTGSVIGSALGGTIIAGLGVGPYFMILAVPLALAALATLLVPQHAAHEEQIQGAREG